MFYVVFKDESLVDIKPFDADNFFLGEGLDKNPNVVTFYKNNEKVGCLHPDEWVYIRRVEDEVTTKAS